MLASAICDICSRYQYGSVGPYPHASCGDGRGTLDMLLAFVVLFDNAYRCTACSYRGERGVSAYFGERCESSYSTLSCVTLCSSCFFGFQAFASTNVLGGSACADGSSTVFREESNDERSGQQRMASRFLHHTYRHAYAYAHTFMRTHA
jgi:hypothetical protein